MHEQPTSYLSKSGDMMKDPITIHDLIGKWISFRLMPNLPKELIGQTTGILNPEAWIKAKLLGTDEIGVWLENPHFTITYLRDREGNPIPPNQQKATTEPAAVLIKWQFIAFIMCTDTDESEHKRPSMGFIPLGTETENA